MKSPPGSVVMAPVGVALASGTLKVVSFGWKPPGLALPLRQGLRLSHVGGGGECLVKSVYSGKVELPAVPSLGGEQSRDVASVVQLSVPERRCRAFMFLAALLLHIGFGGFSTHHF